MTWVFIQNFIECVNGFFVSFVFNQVKASFKGFIVNDNNSSDSLFAIFPAGSFECNYYFNFSADLSKKIYYQ